MSRLIKESVFRILLLVFSLIAVTLVLELVFRIFDIRYPDPKTGTWREAVQAESHPGVRYKFQPFSEFYVTYDGNPDGYFDKDNRLYYRLNNYGFRGENFRMKKPPGVYRIMVLGDSFTFGDGVKLEDTFVLQLQNQLRKMHPKVEVLNFATSGWNTVDQISYLYSVGHKFEPDLVVIAYVLNDGPWELWPVDMFKDEIAKAFEERIFPASYFLTYAHTTWMRYQLSKRYIREKVQSLQTHSGEWRRSLRYLQRGKEITESIGADYFVILLPYLYELNKDHPFLPLQNYVGQFCVENNIAFQDLFDSFVGQNHVDLWAHPTDQHPNAKGHRIIAEALKESIQQREFLD